MDERFVNEGRFNEEGSNEEQEVRTETFAEKVKRKWSETTLMQKAAIIGGGVLVFGGIFYANGKKAGKMNLDKKLRKELEDFRKNPTKAKLVKGGVVETALYVGKTAGESATKKDMLDILAAGNGKDNEALMTVLKDAVEKTLDSEHIAMEAFNYIDEVIDQDFTKEIEKAAGKMAVEALKNDGAMRDVVYDAASKAAKRVVENGDLVEGIVKRSATNVTEDFLTSKRFRKEVKELVNESLADLADDLTPTIEKVVDKYIEKNYD